MGDHRTITVGHYMELKVAYRQKNKNVIENSLITTPFNLQDEYAVKMTVETYVQATQKRDPHNPAHQSRFFMFLVQHYESRLRNIFEKANTGKDEYNAVLANFDKKASTHFTRPKRRDIQAVLSSTQPATWQQENETYNEFHDYQRCSNNNTRLNQLQKRMTKTKRMTTTTLTRDLL
eukprot:4417476-Amphidinium_carterae.1